VVGTASKPMSWEPSLLSSSGKLVTWMSLTQFPDDESRDGSHYIGLLAVQPPDTIASPRNLLISVTIKASDYILQV
jgi:hypothetical protein